VMVRQAHHARHYILSLSKDQSNDKGVCKFVATHPQPLFLEGSLKVATEGLFYIVTFLESDLWSGKNTRHSNMGEHTHWSGGAISRLGG